MQYQDILEQNIEDTKEEYKQVVEMLYNIKSEYNDLLLNKTHLETQLQTLNNDYVIKFAELSDIEFKIDEYKSKNIADITKIKYSYKDEIETIKRVKEEAWVKLSELSKKEQELEEISIKLQAKEQTFTNLETKLTNLQKTLEDNQKEIEKKQNSIKIMQEETKRNLKESEQSKIKSQELLNNTILDIEMREKLLEDREKLINDEKLRISDEWSKLKQSKEYLDNLIKNAKANI